MTRLATIALRAVLATLVAGPAPAAALLLVLPAAPLAAEEADGGQPPSRPSLGQAMRPDEPLPVLLTTVPEPDPPIVR